MKEIPIPKRSVVGITDRQKLLRLRRRALSRLARWVLEQEAHHPVEVSFLFVEDREIAELNHRYLGRSGPTDVLAFSQPKQPPGPFLPLLGDVVISTETVSEQSGRWSRTVDEEFLVCLIHGLLHLLGYRDDNTVSRRMMADRQEELARRWKRGGEWFLTR